jgi:hypothetical protein
MLSRIQQPRHAARMYLLTFGNPQGGGFSKLLELASTREGRHRILRALDLGRSRKNLPGAQGKKRLMIA